MTEKPEYWRRKLSALLHDSPDKVIKIVDHEQRAQALAQAEGFELDEQARKQADFAASAADRIPWPKSKVDGEILCRSAFDATDTALKHPLGKSSVDFGRPFPTADAAFEVSQKTRPHLSGDDPRATFLATWRFWQNWASAADERFACLPAETRLPDHTIWNHLSVTSALQGCFGGSFQPWKPGTKPPAAPDRPAFLLLSLGPVQDFIASARNTRDLWSGSYLLSYLAGTALAKIALDFGPDHVLFPNLNNQPILDLLLRDPLWNKVKTSEERENLWKAFRYEESDGKKRLLTPSLPNRFLAVLPAKMTEHPEWRDADPDGRTGAARYAAELTETVRARLAEIAGSVREHCRTIVGDEFDGGRFDRQIGRLLEIHWQTLPWPETIETAVESAKPVPGTDDGHPLDPIRAVQAMLDRMPEKHRDKRYFRDNDSGAEDAAGPLAQVATTWSALFATLSWQHDAVKATRAFDAWSSGGWEIGRDRNKDSLNGKEEGVFTVPTNEGEAKEISRQLADGNEHVFKPGDILGASTLLKRLWHLTWLSKEYPFIPSNGDFGMPNTRALADHQPYADNSDDESDSAEQSKYFAVLALDGDEMGKWISGIKAPEINGQLSEEARTYFEKHGNAEFLKSRRPLSPSFHLQFSELLGNFSIHCARRIVEAFNGRLIYAGGDDVLAMLPADTALSCARALRAAFRGEKSLPDLAKLHAHDDPLFIVEHEGFVKLSEKAAPDGFGTKAGLLDEPVEFPFMVPGPAADCSVGIAIAHFKSPLQDVVRAAQAAEKRAKREPENGGLGRAAVAVTLIKRSGETIEWGCQWESGGLEAFQSMLDGLTNRIVSAKFPHRIVDLIAPYEIAESPMSPEMKMDDAFEQAIGEILEREIDTAADRQRGPKYSSTDVATIRRGILAYVSQIQNPLRKIRQLTGLCQTVAFVARNQHDENPPAPAPAQTSTEPVIHTQSS